MSYESAVDVHDFGFMLKDCSIENIMKTVCEVSTCSSPALKEMSRKAWEFARRHYTRENFTQEYSKVISEIIKIENVKNL